MSLGRHLRLWLYALVVAIFAAGPLGASADDKTPVRRVGLTQINHQLLVTFSFRDAFPPSIQKQLSSGLKTSVLIQLTLEREGSATPLSYWAGTVEITYDLWEDKYLILREDDTGRRRAVVSSKQKAVDLAAELSHIRVIDTERLPPGTYRIRAKIETNPVSKEMLDKIRTWLVKSQSKSPQSASQTNYFGSFVGALVDRRIGEADHTIDFVSQWFKPGAP